MVTAGIIFILFPLSVSFFLGIKGKILDAYVFNAPSVPTGKIAPPLLHLCIHKGLREISSTETKISIKPSNFLSIQNKHFNCRKLQPI